MNEEKNTVGGIIISALSGFYYVDVGGETVTCHAKGVFRKRGITPLVGDRVLIERENENGTVAEILPRSSCLQRPPVANIDYLYIVSSVVNPQPNLFVNDKLTAVAVKGGLTPVMVFTKCDLGDTAAYRDIYTKAGFEVYCCSAKTGEGMDELRRSINGRMCCFTGNSGVGKSSLLNFLEPSLQLETGEISHKLGRGRHTTRSVSLYCVAGGYVADTPGFSSLEYEERSDGFTKDELAELFPEFDAFASDCRFGFDCSHTSDSGCAVKSAVKNGEISESRYDSFVRMYNEVKDIKDWQLKTVGKRK